MKAHELLSDDSKWTTGGGARNMYGRICSANSSEAVCWCALGAVEKCYGEQCGSILDKLYMEVNGNIGKWNDSTTFEQIKATLIKLDI